ncbi:MAG: TRAP transporter large permease [candidate division WOR-3 bacterium]
MSPVTIGFIGLGVMLLLFFLRMPVAFAMMLVGFAGLAYLDGPQAAFYTLSRDIFDDFSSYPLSVVTTFIFLGAFAFASGMGARLYRAAYVWVGHLGGGLVMATILACAGFSAICGSSPATAATMGKIALPEMKKYRYSDALATGAVASAGSMGILIPPSTVFILYGILVEESIGKLFASGILPGILLTLLFIVTVVIVCSRNPALAPPGPQTSWKAKVKVVPAVIEPLILFAFVVGGLLWGWFSPTQAGAIGAAGALIIGLARRDITWKSFVEACRDGVQTSCIVMLLITAGTVFGHFLAVTTIPIVLVDWVKAMPWPPVVVVGFIALLFFVGGMFVSSMALIMMLVPIVLPILVFLKVDLIWFGVMLVLLTESGVVTAPVGVKVCVVKGIATDVPLETIFKGTVPFLAAIIVCMVILTIFPQISTFLPSLVAR